MLTEDDNEYKYGVEYEYEVKDLLAEVKATALAQQEKDIWPDWREGVRQDFTEGFWVRPFTRTRIITRKSSIPFR
jgi:hypothetical protein